MKKWKSQPSKNIFTNLIIPDKSKNTLHKNRSSHRRCSVRKMFLEMSQNSQENTCARVSFLIKACNFIKKEALAQVFSCKFCEILKNTFYTEHLWWLLLDRTTHFTKITRWYLACSPFFSGPRPETFLRQRLHCQWENTRVTTQENCFCYFKSGFLCQFWDKVDILTLCRTNKLSIWDIKR